MAKGQIRPLFVSPEHKGKSVSLHSVVAAAGGFRGRLSLDDSDAPELIASPKAF
jgi:hypothetical protein